MKECVAVWNDNENKERNREGIKYDLAGEMSKPLAVSKRGQIIQKHHSGGLKCHQPAAALPRNYQVTQPAGNCGAADKEH